MEGDYIDIDGVRMFFATATVRFVLLAVLIGVGAYLLISTDWLLGLLSLSFVPFVAWNSSKAHLKLRATWLELQERLTVMSRVMEENLGGIRVVRAFAAQDHEMEKFEKTSAHALELAHQRVGLSCSSAPEPGSPALHDCRHRQPASRAQERSDPDVPRDQSPARGCSVPRPVRHAERIRGPDASPGRKRISRRDDG